MCTPFVPPPFDPVEIEADYVRRAKCIVATPRVRSLLPRHTTSDRGGRFSLGKALPFCLQSRLVYLHWTPHRIGYLVGWPPVGIVSTVDSLTSALVSQAGMSYSYIPENDKLTVKMSFLNDHAKEAGVTPIRRGTTTPDKAVKAVIEWFTKNADKLKTG